MLFVNLPPFLSRYQCMGLLQDLDHNLHFLAFEKMASELNKDQHNLIVNPLIIK